MSNTKRNVDQLEILGLSHSNKRPKSPQPVAQPPNHASSSAQGPSARLHASTSIYGKSKATGQVILSTLKGSMKLLRKGCGGFAPLGSAVDTLLEVLSTIETTAYGSQPHALHDLASDLPQWAIVLAAYVSKQNPEGMSRGIEHLAETLREQAVYIRDQQQFGKFRRLPGSENELEELERCYRRIESAFQQLQTDSSLNTWRILDAQQKDSRLNGLSPVHDARYDSSFSDTIERGRCLENTRTTVLDEARHWIYNKNGAKIYWMNGMAGTGKTTIAFSVCAELKSSRLLGASFFCSRTSSECSDVSRILPTIAYQLAQHFYLFRCALCRKLGEEPNLGQRSISVQFESLIQLPLLEVQDVLPDGLVVVIDALDECSNPRTTETMLNILLEYAAHLPIRFFLTSRPEPSISSPILSKDERSRSILHLHDVEKSLVKADIEIYLTVTLATLSLPIGQIQQLADQAGILFIYAATVSRYILAGGRNNAMSRLTAVLIADTNRGSKKDEGIDKLYRTILATAMDPKRLEGHEVDMIQRVLRTVVCVKEPLTTAALADLLEADVDEVVAALDPLRSVVNITRDDLAVSTLHASFPDFLLSPERSKVFHCEVQRHNSYLTAQCFWHMERSLRFNICDLETSFQLDQEVLDLERRVEQAITSGLSYACRYWSDHLASTTLSPELLSFLDRFLKHRLLFWMEVLSLKKCSNYGEAILGQVMNQLSGNNEYIELRDFAHDARNFATTFAANPCSLSTPRIYISVLPFVPRESRVWKTYWARTQGLIEVEGTGMDARGQSALATWAVGYPVHSVALSSDGQRVVSGTGWYGRGPGEITIWNTSSGTPILGPLNGHSQRVTSVAFSPDDTRIASGSYDSTIRIWDAIKVGLIAGPLQGHTFGVTSVAFSTDGARLASGSDDCTTRMWDVYSGAPLGEPLKHCRGTVMSVAFSPNGAHLASGLFDRTIRVWDFQAGSLAYRPIDGHTGIVHSIAYSHDGLRLVSGSTDRTVRVWDTADGTLFAGPFQGHASAVRSVSFSPDGTRVVSSSEDHHQTICVWETVSGRLLAGPFEGHGGSINSALFTADGTRILSGSNDGTIRVWDSRQGSKGRTKSLGHSQGIQSVVWAPDGTRAASSSFDRTICVWDTHSGALVAGPFTGHTEPVSSVAFSPDGARIVSGSWDYTLRTWDASTGALLVGPIEGHTDYVSSVAFSPGGSQIASGSDDHTIRLWDSHTGAPVTTPFKGHTSTVASIAFSPDGARIVSGSWDQTVRMWDANSGNTLWTSDSHTGEALCVAISPDGTRAVSGSLRTISVFDAESGAVVAAPLHGHTDHVRSVAFSPDGTRVVSGSDDRSLRVWDVESGTTVAGPLKGHTDRVLSVAFSPDGARIISGSVDHTIRIWDVATISHASSTLRDSWSIDENGWLTDSNS